MSRKWLNSTIAAAIVLTAAAGFASQSNAVDAVFARSDSSTSTEASALTRAAYPGDPIPGLDELISTLTVVDELPSVPGYERGCGTGEAPLTELNAERCWSEGVGSMWVGSLRT
jgi:hypothetical protein